MNKQLMINSLAVAISFSALSFPGIVEATCLNNESLSQSARTFMIDSGLAKPGDEIDEPVLKARWQLIESVEFSGKCLLVMTTCTTFGLPKAACGPLDIQVRSGDPFEVLVYDQKSDQIEKFESVFKVPSSLVLETSAGYFVEVFGDSVLAAEKSLSSGIQDIPGLSTFVVRGPRAGYDPNLNRKWFTTQSRFSLRRGQTAEALDIYAVNFDLHLNETFDGCMKVALSEGEACAVAPWGGGLVGRVP